MSRILALARPHRAMFLSAAAMAVVMAPLSTLRPYLIKVMVDDYVFKYDIEGLARIALLLFGVLSIEVVLQYFFLYTTNWLGQVIVRDLRVRVFSHITSLNLRYFDQTPIGVSTTRTINDISTINSIFSEGIITIMADILTVIAVLTLMFVSSWKLTLVCLVVVPFLVLTSYIFKENIKQAFQSVRTQTAVMNAFLQERISGMKIVQIFNAETQEMEKFKHINRQYTGANIDSIFAYSVFYPVVEILSATSLGLMVWYGARGVIDGEVTLGAMVAFPLYINMLFRPIRLLADKFNTLQMGMVAAERVFDLLDDDTQTEKNGHLKAAQLKENIYFEDVSFAYDGKHFVLNNVTFEVESGKTLAIIGSTGSGKTTVISLLNRFYEIQKGQIRIGDTDLQQFTLDSLRSRIAIVLQDVFLFSGTVLENITLRNTDISAEQVIAAAKMIGAHEFIEKLPNGYQYQVMERGATLSMGQRQLISFVRALVFDPDILILDEATSSIDPETESVIQFAIEKLIAKRTSIIIAHRLSTIQHANKILVLEKGAVQEFGTPDELLSRPDGRYRQLYEMQFIQHYAVVVE